MESGVKPDQLIAKTEFSELAENVTFNERWKCSQGSDRVRSRGLTILLLALGEAFSIALPSPPVFLIEDLGRSIRVTLWLSSSLERSKG